jgi:hypothetical protein
MSLTIARVLPSHNRQVFALAFVLAAIAVCSADQVRT